MIKYTGLQFRNEGQKTVEIDIEGVIGGSFWNEDPEYIKNTKEKMKAELKRLSSIKAEIIIVNINSYGGDINHGLSIHDLLAENPAKIITKINGMTASAATIIAMAGNERKMSDNSLFLAHRASTFAMGNINDLNMVVDDLKTIDEKIINLYVKTTGKSKEVINELMDRRNGNGEWLTADEAKEFGFVTEIFEPKKIAAYFSNDILLKFKLPEIPENLLITPVIEDKEHFLLNKLFSKIYNALKSDENFTKTIIMHKNFTFINQVLNVEGLESADGKTFVLTLENIQAINDKFEALEKEKNDNKKSQEDLVQAQNELKTSKDDLTTAINLIDGIHAKVKASEGIENKIAVVTKMLSEKPGQGAAQNLGKDKITAGEVNQEIIDNLEHNRDADANL